MKRMKEILAAIAARHEKSRRERRRRTLERVASELIQVRDHAGKLYVWFDGVLSVSVEMVKERYMPKDGDFVTCSYKDYPRSWVIIYRKTEHDPYECSYYYLMKNVGMNTITFDNYCNAQKTLRPATEEEKRELLDALAKEGKRWNAEKKCIEDLPRWRAEAGGIYYVVNEHGDVSRTEEKYASYDKWLYDFGNYFHTREAAEKVAEKIREIFKNSKAG